MGLADWDDSYSVGIKKLDDQHKRLFEIINEMNNLTLKKTSSVIFRDVLEKLMEYIIYHFYAEEEFLKKHGYPQFDAHRREHEVMRNQVKGYYTKCVNEDFTRVNMVLEELIDWLHNHLGNSDNQYAEYFKKQGII
jgi:hemerythrin